MQCFGDLIAMEGTNANERCRIGSISPQRQARERRSLQPSKSQVPSGKNNGFNAARGGGQMQFFGDLIAMEGTNANEPCRIGSIRPRRQARERRTLQPSKSQVPSGKTMVSMLQMCLPLVRNQLLTTNTPRLSPH